MTVPAMACPEGNDAAVVSISAPGGRGRSTASFTGPMNSSLVTTASARAASRSQCRRHAMSSTAAMRSGQST